MVEDLLRRELPGRERLGDLAEALVPVAAVPLQPKYLAIAEAQAAGLIVDDVEPADVYALVISLADTWAPISATYAASAEDDAAGHEQRRATLRAAVGRALVPPAPTG